MALPLTACQTTSPDTSSTIEQVASDIEHETTVRVCIALTPERVSRADFDASPPSVREALAKGAAAWVETCPQ